MLTKIIATNYLHILQLFFTNELQINNILQHPMLSVYINTHYRHLNMPCDVPVPFSEMYYSHMYFYSNYYERKYYHIFSINLDTLTIQTPKFFIIIYFTPINSNTWL